MNEVTIKTIKRKTTIPKAVIKKAAKAAYAPTEKLITKNTISKKVDKAA